MADVSGKLVMWRADCVDPGGALGHRGPFLLLGGQGIAGTSRRGCSAGPYSTELARHNVVECAN